MGTPPVGSGQRIAFVIRSLGVGGAERQLCVLAKGLAGLGHAILVIVYYGGGPRHAELVAAGVRVVSLGKQGRWDLLGPLLRLRSVIRAFRPTIVHGYMPDGNLVSLISGRLIYPAAVVWGVRSSHYDFGIYDRFFRLLFRVSCRLAGRADLIIANSVAGREYHVAHGFPVDRCVVIPNGIDTERFRPDAERRARQRLEWGVPNDGILMGIVGRLDPMKDHPTFLRAAALVARRILKAYFVVVGDGPAPYRHQLLELARELGIAERVRWVPTAEDVPAAYNALDLFMSLSNSGEGFPNVIGEAMASGLRCVVTAMGDSELVLGGMGIIVPVGDPAAVASACVQLCQDPAHLPAPEARRRVEMEFGVGALAQRTEEALRSALVRREGRRGA